MEITKEMMARIAALSRLRLDGEDAELQRELQQILAYMDTLQEVDTFGVEPMSHVLALHNVMRDDNAEPYTDCAQLLRNAPDTDGISFLVPRAVE